MIDHITRNDNLFSNLSIYIQRQYNVHILNYIEHKFIYFLVKNKKYSVVWALYPLLYKKKKKKGEETFCGS
jgi:hypothetical protein